MRKSKKSKILSLMLCMSMILSTFAFTSGAAVAEETGTTAATAEQQPTDKATDSTKATTSTDATKSSQQDTDKNDITKMTVKEQFEYLTSLKTDAEKEAEIKKLSQAQYEALQAYVEEKSAAAEPKFEDLNIVSSSAVAPLVKASSSTARKQAKSQAKATATDTGTKEEGLILKKTAKDNGDGSYNITLESYVTGKVTTSTTEISKPADIVLVLDVSGSMADDMELSASDLDTEKGKTEGYYKVYRNSSWHNLRFYNGQWQYYTDGFIGIGQGWHALSGDLSGYTYKDGSSKMDALKTAVDNFIQQVYNDSLGKDGAVGGGDDVDHRISIVKFAGKKINDIGNNMYRDSGYTYNYSQIVNGLISAKDNLNTLKNNLSSLTPAGATSADYGMQHAQTIVNGINTTRDSNKVVVMFTDGEPTYGNSFSNTVANNTISASKSIKANGATVYTVGIFKDADDTTPMPLNANNMNKYMHYVSSNFKNAQSLTNSGGDSTYPAQGKSYYLAADSTAKLNDIFQTISQETTTGGASITLDKTTSVKDIVSPYFDMPTGASDITVSTADYEGYEDDGNRKFGEASSFSDADIRLDTTNNTITVSNFDFSSDENCVTDTTKNGSTSYTGRKLIISFNVKPKADFLGGNGIITNGSNSGVYKDDGTSVKKFEQPNVDVKTKEITPKTKDQNIYITNNADLKKLLDGTDSRINGTNNAYADITYTIKDGDTVIGTLTIPKGTDTTAEGWTPNWTWSETGAGTPALEDDKTYTITCEVNGGTGNVSDTTNPPTADVNVFKPELTYKDSTVYYGATAPTSYDNNKTGEVWKHGDTVDTAVTMTGTKPELTISYDPNPYEKNAVNNSSYYEGGVISTKNDIPVKVTVKIGNKDVTNHVTFEHTDCKPESGFNSENEQFLIHVKTCSLTVAKTGGEDGEPYVMNIYKDGKLYTSMTIVGNSSATVKELPVGTYTVQEDTDWAWRYKSPNISEAVELSKTTTSGTITVMNHDRYNSFLNGYSTVVQNVYGKIFDKIN